MLALWDDCNEPQPEECAMNAVGILLAIATSSLVVFVFASDDKDRKADEEFIKRCEVRGGALIETTNTRYCIDKHVVSLEEPR